MCRLRAGARYRALARLMEENAGNPEHPELCGAMYDGQGRQHLGTMYYMVRLPPDKALKGVPESRPGPGGGNFDMPGYMKIMEDALEARAARRTVRVALGALEACAMPLMRIGDCIFNPQFVTTCMELLDAGEAVLEFNVLNSLAVIVVRAENGAGFVAPHRPGEKSIEEYEEHVPLSERGQRG